jgi:hypothetical protein
MNLDNTCPSELELDRYHFGELRTTKEEELARHIEECSTCATKLRARERGFSAFASVDADRLFARVEARLEAVPKPSWIERMQRLLFAPQALWPAAVAAMVALVFVSLPQTEDDAIRSKGSLSLSVFRERNGAVEELTGDEAEFRTGDRVRFKIHLPEKTKSSQILILGVEETGKVSTYYPSDGSERSAPPEVRPDGALAGAIQLDAYRGKEWLHLVLCPRGFGVGDLEKKGPADLRAPKECERTSFLMKRIE